MNPSAPEEKPSPQRPQRGGDLVALTVAICLGIIREQRVRRSVLFVVMISIMLMLFGGVVVFDQWLAKHPIVFLLYWGACLWLTGLSILMALYDMLMVRKAGALSRRRLAEDMAEETNEEIIRSASQKPKRPSDPPSGA